MPRSCASPAPDVLPAELDEPVPLETEPEVPLLDVLPLGLLLPELMVPEPVVEEPEVLLALGWLLLEPEVLLPLGWLLLELVVPERFEDDDDAPPLPLDTDPLVEPEGLVLLTAPPVAPEERPPGAALALDDDCASLLHASKSACAGLRLCAKAPPDTATTVAAVKIAVAVLKDFMMPPP